MSLLGKKWVIKNESEELTIIAKLLKNRGIDSPEKAELFFNGTMDDLHDPNLLKEVSKAVDRIKKAIQNKEKIMIFGDYDVDGVTATAVMYDFLKKVEADVHYTLPNRENDGYGLKDYFIRQFKEQNIDLIITVDCGTSNFKEIELANELGIDVVVTDHHSMPKKLPNACAIVNPQRPDCEYPNKEICGASLAYKIVTILANDLWNEEQAKTYLDHQLGIVALGIVADCMALTGENRIMVREGAKRLNEGKHASILALLKEANLPTDNITSTTIGFQIGPRINAAGRIDDPLHAFELLIGNLEKATKLNELNAERREYTQQYVKEAVAEIEQMESIPNIIVLKNKAWRSGLLGLIASGVADRFHRPTIAMQERETEFVASMRSVDNFDITGAVREAAGELFSAFGGHVMAGGFTLPKENINEFLDRVEKAGESNIDPNDFVGSLPIDCEIKPDELNFETCHKINRLEPFGAENPQPNLLIKNVKILKLRSVGSNAEHLQFPIQHGDQTIGAIAFRFGQHLDKIDPAKPHDLVCNLEINEWNGRKKLQLRVVDLKPSE
ncbi:single-stranded-DNA-specific exonuclease RecJ [Candidatus Pacearchaeota archaeon]|nr:single-stranded-DNA-specific exonuclease RecJ [Candidatus Pacearchaeota archaeon]